MTMGCHKLNQVVTPIAAAAPDVVSLLEQISTFPGTWDAASDLAMPFLLYLLVKIMGSCLAFIWCEQQYTSTLLPFVIILFSGG